jgi:hypothetical protein
MEPDVHARDRAASYSGPEEQVMSPTVSTRLVLVLLCVVALVGAVDAVVEGHWDLAAVFGSILALTVLLLLRHQSRRPPVPLRGDLVAWLRERGTATGEDPEIIADRALSAYRAGLVATEPDRD